LLHLQLPVERAQTSGKPGEGTAGKLSKKLSKNSSNYLPTVRLNFYNLLKLLG
jgi:hypothetical protein